NPGPSDIGEEGIFSKVCLHAGANIGDDSKIAVPNIRMPIVIQQNETSYSMRFAVIVCDFGGHGDCVGSEFGGSGNFHNVNLSTRVRLSQLIEGDSESPRCIV